MCNVLDKRHYVKCKRQMTIVKANDQKRKNRDHRTEPELEKNYNRRSYGRSCSVPLNWQKDERQKNKRRHTKLPTDQKQ